MNIEMGTGGMGQKQRGDGAWIEMSRVGWGQRQ